MLEIEDLRVVFETTVAVDDFHMHLEEGRHVTLLGANGAGKSSVLRAISGLVRYSGRIRFLGEDITGRSADEIARRGLIHVPEGRRVFPTLSVEENLMLGTAARGRRSVGEYSLSDVYDLFPQLGTMAKRSGWALSGGEQQMLAVGRALLGAPQLLMLDEPSLGLAPVVVDTVFSALRQIEASTTVLVVEQNTNLALDFCHHGYVLNTGKVVLDASAAELSQRRDLIDAYLGISSSDDEEGSEHASPDQIEEMR